MPLTPFSACCFPLSPLTGPSTPRWGVGSRPRLSLSRPTHTARGCAGCEQRPRSWRGCWCSEHAVLVGCCGRVWHALAGGEAADRVCADRLKRDTATSRKGCGRWRRSWRRRIRSCSGCVSGPRLGGQGAAPHCCSLPWGPSAQRLRCPLPALGVAEPADVLGGRPCHAARSPLAPATRPLLSGCAAVGQARSFGTVTLIVVL